MLFLNSYPSLDLSFSQSAVTSTFLDDNLDVALNELEKAMNCDVKPVLLMMGGADVNPEIYDEKNRYSHCDHQRDIRDFSLMYKAYSIGMPMFGICRGHQAMCVFFGGTLIQDIGFDAGCKHSQYHSANVYGELAKYLGVSTYNINSYHHQAVNKIPPNAAVIADAPDGIIEGLIYDGYPAVSVQWHPEYINDANIIGFVENMFYPNH